MSMRSIVPLGALVLAALAVGPSPRPVGGQPSELPLKIVTLSGHAEVNTRGASAWKAASLRADIGPGDGARTLAGGRLTLRTVSGQALRLAPLSRITLLEAGATTDQPTRVRMDAGSVWVAVMPGSPPQESIEVRTGAAMVAVRGGGAGITLGRDGSVFVRVYHGAAECSGPGAERQWNRALAAEQEMLVSVPGAPGEVRKLTRDKLDADWVKWNEEQDLAGGYGGKPPER